MGHNTTNGTIDKPVNTDDGVAIVGGSHDVGTLGMRSTINGMSKIKPIKHTKIGGLTDADRKSVQYGIINIPRFSKMYEMAMFIANGLPYPMGGAKTEYWAYDRPGVNDYKRLEDFDGYWHYAQPPIAPIVADKIVVDRDGGSTNKFVEFPFPVATDARNLKLSDFDLCQLSNSSHTGDPYYFGVCITDGKPNLTVPSSNPEDYTGTRFFTQSSKINDNLVTETVGGKACINIRIPISDFVASDKVPPQGEMYIFAFLTTTPITTFSKPTASGADFIPLTMSAKKMILITGDRLFFTFTQLTGTKLSTGSTGTYMGRLDYKITVKNQTNMAFYIQGGSIWAENMYGTQVTSNTFISRYLLPAGATYTFQGSLNVTSAGTYTVKASYNDVDGNSSYTIGPKSVTLS